MLFSFIFAHTTLQILQTKPLGKLGGGAAQRLPRF